MLPRILKFGAPTALALLISHYTFVPDKLKESPSEHALTRRKTIALFQTNHLSVSAIGSEMVPDDPYSSITPQVDLARDLLEDCQAIYIQKAVDSVAAQLTLWGEGPFSEMLELGCQIDFANETFIPPFPYEICKGDIEVEFDSDSNDVLVADEVFPLHPPASFNTSFTPEEALKLRGCVNIHRSNAEKILFEAPLVLDSSTSFKIFPYLARGCKLEPDRDAGVLHVQAPEPYDACLEVEPAFETLTASAKRELLHEVYDLASEALQMGDFVRAFRLISPAHLNMEVQLSSDGRRPYYEHLLSFIESEPGTPAGVCSSFYNVEGKIDKDLNLLPLLYEIVAKGMEVCDFDDQ